MCGRFVFNSRRQLYSSMKSGWQVERCTSVSKYDSIEKLPSKMCGDPIAVFRRTARCHGPGHLDHSDRLPREPKMMGRAPRERDPIACLVVVSPRTPIGAITGEIFDPLMHNRQAVSSIRRCRLLLLPCKCPTHKYVAAQCQRASYGRSVDRI